MEELNKLKGNVLITGGLGFIGSNLAHSLVDSANVTLFTKSTNKLRNIKEIQDKVEIIQGDITDTKKVESIVKDKDHIFHFAGQNDHILSLENPLLDVDINCKGTLNILESARKFSENANIIFSSTESVVGKIAKLPASEDQQENPLSLYEVHKLTGEKYLYIYNKVYGLNTTTLRFANVFGERQTMKVTNRGILNQMIRRTFLGEPITVYGDGSFIRDYSYIKNFIDACILAALSPNTNGEVYMMGSGKGLSFKDMVTKINETVKDLTGKSTEIKNVPFPETEKKIDRGDIIIDYSKFNKATGWFPKVSFEEGLKRTILFYKDRLDEYL
jgi:UDP-glucose 4-epimerase